MKTLFICLAVLLVIMCIIMIFHLKVLKHVVNDNQKFLKHIHDNEKLVNDIYTTLYKTFDNVLFIRRDMIRRKHPIED